MNELAYIKDGQSYNNTPACVYVRTMSMYQYLQAREEKLKMLEEFVKEIEKHEQKLSANTTRADVIDEDDVKHEPHVQKYDCVAVPSVNCCRQGNE